MTEGYKTELGEDVREDETVEGEVDVAKGGVGEIPAASLAIDPMEFELGSVLVNVDKVLKN